SQNKVNGKAQAYIDYSPAYLAGTGANTVTAGTGVEVSATDASSIDAEITVGSMAAADAGTPFSDESATGVAGAVSLNDVRGGALAKIEDAEVMTTGGNVVISALENATLDAHINSDAKSTTTSITSTDSLAVNAVIATNLVQSSAEALVVRSSVDNNTDAADVDADNGQITVSAANTSSIDASVDSKTESEGTSVGVTLAFNTIGWESQNFLFNTVDALFGTSLGDENPAATRAAVTDSDLRAAGGVSVTADSSATIHAT